MLNLSYFYIRFPRDQGLYAVPADYLTTPPYFLPDFTDYCSI